MSEDEARLRVQLARKRGLVVRQCVQDIQKLNTRTNASSKREFITPLSSKLSSDRWKSFASNVAKQIYGVKQEGLLQFPEEVKRSLRTENAAVTHDVIKTAEEFVSLLSNLQILDDDENAQSDSVSESNFSLVESEVVEELQKKGEMSQRIAQLAALRLDRNEETNIENKGNVPLPDGRQMKLVQDTLSHRLGNTKPVIVETCESAKHQRDTNRLPAGKYHRHRFNFNARRQREVDIKQRPLHQKNLRRRQVEDFPRRYKTSSKIIRGRLSTDVITRLESEESSWCSEDEEEHEELMSQLVSLLNQQEATTANADHEEVFHSALVKVEALLNRLEKMEAWQKSNEEGEEGSSEDDMDNTMEKAREALASLNFAEEMKREGEEMKSDSEELSPSPSSDSLLKEINRKKEIFWANFGSDQNETE